MIEKLEHLREAKGMKQQDLEYLAKLPRGRYSKWKSGQGEPTGSQSLRLSQVLSVPIEWLLDDTAGLEPPVAPEFGPKLSPEEQLILDHFRTLQRDSGLTFSHAMTGLSLAAHRAAQPPLVEVRIGETHREPNGLSYQINDLEQLQAARERAKRMKLDG